MDLTPKNTVLIDRFEKTLKVKRSTARVYASSIASLAKKMNEKTDDLSWLKKKKIKKRKKPLTKKKLALMESDIKDYLEELYEEVEK